jgi:hypothetical protein
MGWTFSADGGEACIGFWWVNLRERDHWGDPGVNGSLMLRRIFSKCDLGIRTRLSWLRIGIVEGHF